MSKTSWKDIGKPKRFISIDASSTSAAFAIFENNELVKFGKVNFTGNDHYKKAGDACKKLTPLFKDFDVKAVVIYLILASIWKIKRTEYLTRRVYFESDFLEWTNDVYYYFGLSLTLLCVSVAVYILEKDIFCNAN